jgi:hypothetical protein
MSLFSAMADENSVWARGSALFNISRCGMHRRRRKITAWTR